MSKNIKISFVALILFGIILPFIPFLHIIQMFFLLIPFAVFFIISLIYLVISLLNKNLNTRKALFVFSILPVFITSQISSIFIVNKIQRFRSDQIISEIEKIKSENGLYPKKYEIKGGIVYCKTKNSKYFEIQYSRGFLVSEKYDSKNKSWTSYGWND